MSYLRVFLLFCFFVCLFCFCFYFVCLFVCFFFVLFCVSCSNAVNVCFPLAMYVLFVMHVMKKKCCSVVVIIRILSISYLNIATARLTVLGVFKIYWSYENLSNLSFEYYWNNSVNADMKINVFWQFNYGN